jgi:hypothetical protein
MTAVIAPTFGTSHESGNTIVYFQNGLTGLWGVGVWLNGQVLFAEYFPSWQLALADFIDQCLTHPKQSG